MSESSEFGAGIVVCLAKFSEHLWHDRERAIYSIAAHAKGERSYESLSPSERVSVDVSRDLGYGTEGAVSLAIELWANGASDHFYELDRDRAPDPLCQLADLTLEMGHGFTGKRWTLADYERVRDLWRESCIAVDRMLGTSPDWGQW